MVDFLTTQKIHGFHNCLFNSLAAVLTSILASLCVTCEPAAVRKIQSAPMTRPALGRSDSSAATFYEFPSIFPRISLKFWPRRFAAARGEGWQASNDTYWGSACEPTEYVTTGKLARVHTTHVK